MTTHPDDIDDGAALSARHEPCTSCGDPLFACPGTLRRFVRCCDDCTHTTAHDRSWHTVPSGQPTRPTQRPPAVPEAS